MKSELFSTWAVDANVLKNFVRTQIYRPIFFNPTNYISEDSDDGHAFTTNESAYWCKTTKWYVNHNEQKYELKLVWDS